MITNIKLRDIKVYSLSIIFKLTTNYTNIHILYAILYPEIMFSTRQS